MKHNKLLGFILLSSLLLGFSCSSSKSTSNEVDENKVSQDDVIIISNTFTLPEIPLSIIDTDERTDYLVMHYWDGFDFSNIKLIDMPEITEQAFVDYINIVNYASEDKIESSLRGTLKLAEVETLMYKHFCNLFEKYLYEPNSPFRNEELYIPVLKDMTKSKLLSEAERQRFNYQYEFTQKNRVGYKANDFVYTLATEESNKMSSIDSEYLILFFSNPECSTCASVASYLDRSSFINEALSYNTPQRTMLTILTIYPDDDIDVWRKHLDLMPSRWLHSYDAGMHITKKKLYDLKAIPSIYLLDKNKKVILKDTDPEILEAFFDLPR